MNKPCFLWYPIKKQELLNAAVNQLTQTRGFFFSVYVDESLVTYDAQGNEDSLSAVSQSLSE